MYSLLRFIKKIIPVNVKARTKYLFSSSSYISFNHYRNKKKVIVTLAADYGNLGDVAITFAQEKFLNSCLPGYEIVDFPISSTFTRLKALKRTVAPGDIITIVGGGNMGDLHYTIEDCRRFIIQNFPNNRIVSFPQTIDFSDNSFGRRELNKTVQRYNSHRNLHVFARESTSFNIMKKLFSDNQVYLAPDIVLSLDMSRPETNRNGVMLCLRNDNESAFSTEKKSVFLHTITEALPYIKKVDTHIGKDGLTIQEREYELFKLLESFRSVEVAITDRLHGMILSAITGTPCVVLQNNNHKIKSTYITWLNSLAHIRLQNNYDVDETIKMVNELKNIDQDKIHNPELAVYFDSLKEVITG